MGLLIHPDELQRVNDSAIQVILARAGIEHLLSQKDPENERWFDRLLERGSVHESEDRTWRVRDDLIHPRPDDSALTENDVARAASLYLRVLNDMLNSAQAPLKFDSLVWDEEPPSAGYVDAVAEELRRAIARLKGQAMVFEASFGDERGASRRQLERRRNSRHRLAFRAEAFWFWCCIAEWASPPAIPGGAVPIGSVLPVGKRCIMSIQRIPDSRIRLIMAAILFEYMLYRSRPAWFAKESKIGTIVFRHREKFANGPLLHTAIDARNALLHGNPAEAASRDIEDGTTEMYNTARELASAIGGEIFAAVVHDTAPSTWPGIDEHEVLAAIEPKFRDVLELMKQWRAARRAGPRGLFGHLRQMKHWASGWLHDVDSFVDLAQPRLEAHLEQGLRTLPPTSQVWFGHSAGFRAGSSSRAEACIAQP